MHTDTLIVGSGLAGMTAAVLLSEAGQTVHVLEANRFLGGRTSSWSERGMEIESGFHRFLGFYTALPDILKKVGISLDDMLYWEDEVEIRVPDGVHATLGMAPLHKPLKTAWNMLGHTELLSPADKLAIGKMLAAGAKEYVAAPLALDQKTVEAYAREHKVDDKAIQHLLVPLTEGIFFVPVDQYSMYNLMGLFMPYLKTLPKLRVGAFMGGMSTVMMQSMADFVLAHKGAITTERAVSDLLTARGGVVGVRTSKGDYHANNVILAASLKGAQDIIMRSFTGHPWFRNMLRLKTMPAVTFQIELSEPCMELDRTTFGPGTAMTSFAEQSRTTFRQSAGRLSIILSPPERFMAMPAAGILGMVIKDAKRLGIQLEGKVLDYRKVVLPHDFYSLRTGSEALRPSQKTDIPGLTLAGDYTRQPYLATMEGAVVSGKLAAELVNR